MHNWEFEGTFPEGLGIRLSRWRCSRCGDFVKSNGKPTDEQYVVVDFRTLQHRNLPPPLFTCEEYITYTIHNS